MCAFCLIENYYYLKLVLLGGFLFFLVPGSGDRRLNCGCVPTAKRKNETPNYASERENYKRIGAPWKTIPVHALLYLADGYLVSDYTKINITFEAAFFKDNFLYSQCRYSRERTKHNTRHSAGRADGMATCGVA